MSLQFAEPHWLPSSCYGGTGNGKAGICIHHAATTDFYGIGNTLEARGLSTTFACGDGIAQQLTDYDACTWHCGNAWGNDNLISIETVNCGGDAEGWPVSDATFQTLVELCAKIARDCGMGALKRGANLWGHKDFYATFCPGVLYPRLDELCDKANAINNQSGASARETEEPMEFIYRPNQESVLKYFDGHASHPLSHPDEVTAIQMCYRQCYGKDIPMFELGSKKAPWATRFEQAIQR